MSDQQLTNLSYLENLSMGDESIIIEMVELFLNNTPESLGLIKQYYDEEDWSKLAAEAHKLKPNFSYVGLEGARDILVEIEDNAREQNDLDSIDSKLERIDEICQEAYTELQNILAEMK